MTRRPGLALIAIMAACGGPALRVEQYPTPQALFTVSMKAYRNGDCKRATIGLQHLANQLSARDSLQPTLKYYLAECALKDGHALEAARQFRRVADDSPRDRLAPDALLRAGDAYAHLWGKPQLDPTYGQNAIDTWRELQGRYSGSPAAGRARLRIRDLQNMLAMKSYQTGEFYRRFHAYDSAIIYYKEVVANYPESSFAPDAVLALIATYDRLGYREEVNDMCGYLRQYYPQAVPDADACPSPSTVP